MYRFTINKFEVFFLLLILLFGFTTIGSLLNEAVFNTLILFLFVAIYGLLLCHKTWHSLKDPNLRLLGLFWLIKLSACLFLLFIGWIPQLDPGYETWGIDPQRFYQYSWNLVLNDWSTTVNLNYQGIIYYYAFIFYLFGHNPVIPALINNLVTLVSTLFLIRCLYDFSPIRTSNHWRVAFLLLIPEVLWYDVMTSRESLMASLIIFSVLAVGLFFVGKNQKNLTNTLAILFFSSMCILVVRTSMLLPVVLSIAFINLLIKSRRKKNKVLKVFFLVSISCLLLSGPLVQSITGGSDFNLFRTLDQIQSFEKNIAIQSEWSEASIGLLLAPKDIWQSIVFIPPRMVLYLASPLPKLNVSIYNLLGGSWEDWQLLMTVSTSLLMILGFHYVLAGSHHAWHNRDKFPSTLVIPILFWTTFTSIAGGNIIIHERYRLMITLLLFACMWYGHNHCPLPLIKRWAFIWFSLLISSAIFYIYFKFI